MHVKPVGHCTFGVNLSLVIIFVLLEHLVAIYVTPRGVVITLVNHVWDVCPYLSCNIRNIFPINKISYQSWLDRSTRGIVKHVYILAVCPYNVCDILPCQLNMAWDHACWKMQIGVFVTMWKENYQNTRIVNVQIMCHNALYIEILMIYGIINLHNHMHFFRYIDVLPSTVVFHFH